MQSATYDFLLVIYSNRGPISYPYLDKRRFGWKIDKFFHPRVSNAPAVEFPSEICNGGAARKTRMMPIREGQNDDMFIRLVTISAFNGQTEVKQ